VGDPREGRPGGLDQRPDDLILDLVGQVARRDGALEPPPLILDMLVLEQLIDGFLDSL
jgi:hypothetical protein